MQSLEYNQILSRLKEAKFVIMDERVSNHYPELINKGGEQCLYIVSNAEKSKNISEFEKISLQFLKAGITRNDTIFVIGGGATSDLGGFVAATILRGVDWIVIPTTLLAMIDAAIGGKVGVNTDQGKNLIGSFYEPKDILVSKDFLKTLPEDELLSGKGELLKYLFLSKEVHHTFTQKGFSQELIFECASYKKIITTEDFTESGKRKILNLGHTLGHAFEKTLSLKHGVAVMYGLELILKLFAKDLIEKFDSYKKELGLADLTFSRCDFLAFKKYLEFDKKRIDANSLEIIIPDASFETKIQKTSFNTLIEKLQTDESYKYYFK